MYRIIYFPFVFFLLAFSCKQYGSASSNDSKSADTLRSNAMDAIEIVSPRQNERIISGTTLCFKAKLTDTTKIPDSIQFLVDGKKISTVRSVDESFMWSTAETKLGNRNAGVIAYFSGGVQCYVHHKIFVKLNKAPAIYTYNIIHTYPHDKNAYTQGLVYENEGFYESTGLKKQSTLRKIKLETGQLLKTFGLPDDIFGEGIAVVDNKIFQITWQEQIAFLFDKETFQVLNKYFYPIKEGWGLTYDGSNLIMSDGSSTLYFMDKEYFTEVGRLEVFDNKGAVDRLNELEYINNEVWANIYTTDTIVRINPKTGAVTAKIDLSGLLKPGDKTNNTDVLNGIAYDTAKKRIFVTGKNWPKLFEISISEKI